MNWKKKAIDILKDSLYPTPSELNELDWKSGLSCKSERLAQHLSAMANQKGGGILVYGIHDDGTCFSLSQSDIKNVIQLLGNIAKNNMAYSISIEHSVMEYDGCSLLFIYIPEQMDKPLYLRGKDIYDSYHRSAGQTIKMSKNQVKAMIAESQGITFERQIAKSGISKSDVLDILNYKVFYQLLDKNLPNSTDTILDKLEEYNFCLRQNDTWCITNLGAILLTNNITLFPNL
jgi:ATP-dependent DNA helicase RecG